MRPRSGRPRSCAHLAPAPSEWTTREDPPCRPVTGAMADEQVGDHQQTRSADQEQAAVERGQTNTHAACRQPTAPQTSQPACQSTASPSRGCPTAANNRVTAPVALPLYALPYNPAGVTCAEPIRSIERNMSEPDNHDMDTMSNRQRSRHSETTTDQRCPGTDRIAHDRSSGRGLQLALAACGSSTKPTRTGRLGQPAARVR